MCMQFGVLVYLGGSKYIKQILCVYLIDFEL